MEVLLGPGRRHDKNDDNDDAVELDDKWRWGVDVGWSCQGACSFVGDDQSNGSPFMLRCNHMYPARHSIPATLKKIHKYFREARESVLVH